MRRTFIDILQDNSNLNIDKEYQRLHYLFYEKKVGIAGKTMFSYINEHFLELVNRKNAISLQDFEEENKIPFRSKKSIDGNIDEMLLFCEYISNYCEQLETGFSFKIQDQLDLVKTQIYTFIDSFGYEKITKEDVILYVPKEPAAIEVAECIEDDDVSYKVLCYNHYSLKGDIEGKRVILENLAHKLEPKGKDLSQINPGLKNLLFGAFNNLDIRHNNIEAKDGYFNKNFSQLQEHEKEELYDYVYRYCLMAFLELECSPISKKIKTIIKR